MAPRGGHGGPGLLRHGLGHGQLPHDLRLLPRRRHPGIEVLAPHQPPHPDAEPIDLLRRGVRLHPGHPVDVELGRLRGGHLDRRHRPLHRLRHPHPCCAGWPATPSRPARGTSGSGAPVVGWVGIVWVGIITILFVPPDRQPDHLAQLQLHDRGGRGRPRSTPASSGW